ncbi:MAG: transporter [Burkholderiaceae bacterium]|nr:transporter [Burkholderiaceae bacterium]
MTFRCQIAAWLLIASGAAGAAQPLSSDDAQVQGAGRWQLEAGFQQSVPQSAAGGPPRTESTTLTRGLDERTDAYVSALHSRGSLGAGWGDLTLGLKWLLLEQGPFSLAFKPWLTLPTGNQWRGLGTGRVSAGALMAMQTEVGPLSLLANAGVVYQPTRWNQRQWLWQISSAVLYHVTDRLQLAIDTVVARNTQWGAKTNPAWVIAGVIYTPRPWIDLDVGYYHRLNDAAGPNMIMAGVALHW